MNKLFSYSVLQHHYSSFIDEVINIGVLFYFPNEKILEFQLGDLGRLKCLYADVDINVIENITEGINNRIGRQYDSNSLFNLFFNEEELHKIFLKEDDSALQFTKPKKSLYPSFIIVKIIEQYSLLLLPALKEGGKRFDFD